MLFNEYKKKGRNIKYDITNPQHVSNLHMRVVFFVFLSFFLLSKPKRILSVGRITRNYRVALVDPPLLLLRISNSDDSLVTKVNVASDLPIAR